jgi:hypothetical protein
VATILYLSSRKEFLKIRIASPCSTTLPVSQLFGVNRIFRGTILLGELYPTGDKAEKRRGRTNDSAQSAKGSISMARRPMPPRKRRTREHVIADLSINHVERHVLLAGNVVERWLHDYGLDLVLFTFTPDGEVEPGEVYLQVKATERLRWSRDKSFVAFRIERADLRSWLVQPFPVILIVYDVSNDRAYWHYIQAAFTGAQRFRAARGSERLTIRIPSTQIFGSDAVRRFRGFLDDILEQ